MPCSRMTSCRNIRIYYILYRNVSYELSTGPSNGIKALMPQTGFCHHHNFARRFLSLAPLQSLPDTNHPPPSPARNPLLPLSASAYVLILSLIEVVGPTINSEFSFA